MSTSHPPLCTPIPPSASTMWQCPELPAQDMVCFLLQAPPIPLVGTQALTAETSPTFPSAPSNVNPSRVAGTKLPNSLEHGADLSSKRFSFRKPSNASGSVSLPLPMPQGHRPLSTQLSGLFQCQPQSSGHPMPLMSDPAIHGLPLASYRHLRYSFQEDRDSLCHLYSPALGT